MNAGQWMAGRSNRKFGGEHGLTWEQGLAIARLLLGGNRLEALLTFRMATRVDFTPALDFMRRARQDLLRTIRDDQEMMEQLSPEVCCLRCVGICGRVPDSMQNEEGDWRGNNCDQFQNKQNFMERRRTIVKIWRELVLRNGRVLTVRREIVIDDGLVAMRTLRPRVPGAPRRGDIVKVRMLTMAPARALAHVLKLLGSHADEELDARRWNIEGIADLGSNSLRVAGVEPSPNESYKDYLDRAMEAMRSERRRRHATVAGMSQEQVGSALMDHFEFAGLGPTLRKDFGNNPLRMAEQLYPMKSPWDALLQLTGG